MFKLTTAEAFSKLLRAWCVNQLFREPLNLFDDAFLPFNQNFKAHLKITISIKL